MNAQAAEFVAAALKYPDWAPGTRLEGNAGPVILGRPPHVERFPGDPGADHPRLPPVNIPAPGNPDKDAPARAEEVVITAALPEGETGAPVHGYLYFPFQGKAKRIRSLELDYAGPVGQATLPLL